jgi:predicted TPR repeat methyltransferase
MDLASNYDSQVKEYDSYGHDVLFGMSFEFVKKDENILDIGIGTGLASIKFSHLGLKVYGLDSSQEMLNACKSKSFAHALNVHEITSAPIPHSDNYFNHVISCGVLHFLGDLEHLFKEVKRVIKSGGIFAFTIAPQNTVENFTQEDTAWDTPIFKHSMIYINELLGRIGFDLQKEQRLLIKGADKINYDMEFSALVAKNQ